MSETQTPDYVAAMRESAQKRDAALAAGQFEAAQGWDVLFWAQRGAVEELAHIATKAKLEATSETAAELLAALEKTAPMIGSALSRLRFSTPADATILPTLRAAIAKARGQA